MERRQWEDMNMDCLVNIFGRVGIESLALDVPFVCKSWYGATLNPLCWQSLIFPQYLQFSRFARNPSDWYLDMGRRSKAVVTGAVNQSQIFATELVLPFIINHSAFAQLLEECPALKCLSIHSYLCQCPKLFPYIASKWKTLEKLEILQSDEVRLEEVIVQVSCHCKNLVGLIAKSAFIFSDAALAIVTLLPNIKHLQLRGSFLGRSELVMILKGCKNLVHFDVSYCRGFESNDEEILKLGSCITTFLCEGSCYYDYPAE